MSDHDQPTTTGDSDVPFLPHPVEVDAPPLPADCEPFDTCDDNLEVNREPAELIPAANA